MRPEDPALTKNNQQIDWVLSRSDISPWLKSALTTAKGRDPVDLLHDLDILDHLLRTLSNAQIRSALERRAPSAEAR